MFNLKLFTSFFSNKISPFSFRSDAIRETFRRTRSSTKGSGWLFRNSFIRLWCSAFESKSEWNQSWPKAGGNQPSIDGEMIFRYGVFYFLMLESFKAINHYSYYILNELDSTFQLGCVNMGRHVKMRTSVAVWLTLTWPSCVIWFPELGIGIGQPAFNRWKNHSSTGL